MERIYVYSKSPVHGSGGLEVEMTVVGGYYCYELPAGSCGDDWLQSALDFIFNALIHTFVDNRLRNVAVIEDGADKLFSQKLVAYLYITGSKNKIDNIVASVLQESSVINLDGLLNFRLRDFTDDISAFFDMLFYDYNVQKRYDDFVSLVRDYIKVEAPGEKVIHIVFGSGGFMFYNTKKANITNAALKKYRSDANFADGSMNDFLISSLLHFLPESIVIHTENNVMKSRDAMSKRIIDTIKAIFMEKVTECNRCDCLFCGDGLLSGVSYTVCDDIF